jgi:hypothetical protein
MTRQKHVELDDWSEFEGDLRKRLKSQNFTRMVMFRAFSVRRLRKVLATGTDRTKGSSFWSADGFDYDHTANPGKKSPNEIIYAHRVNTHTSPFTVLNFGEAETSTKIDLSANLDENDAVSIYDSACVERAAINEHWFVKPPGDCLLYVYSLKRSVDEE